MRLGLANGVLAEMEDGRREHGGGDGDDARLGKAPTKRVTAFCELMEGFMEDARTGSGRYV